MGFLRIAVREVMDLLQIGTVRRGQGVRISPSLFPCAWIDAPASGSESRGQWWAVG